jgi:hypothetical protein
MTMEDNKTHGCVVSLIQAFESLKPPSATTMPATATTNGHQDFEPWQPPAALLSDLTSTTELTITESGKLATTSSLALAQVSERKKSST